MTKICVSKEAARNYLLNYQGLTAYKEGKLSIAQYVKKVGCIQFDPLNVVGRNPDLVMQSRIQDYRPIMLDELLYVDRVLIDGWEKMMSIHHIEDWANLKRIRSERTRENLSIMKYRGTEEALKYLDEVRTILKNEGPKFSREIQMSGVAKGPWSSSKYSNVALDHLFHSGDVGIFMKKNSQKCFDVIENLLDRDVLDLPEPFPTEEAFFKWYVKRRIASIGLLWSKNGGGWLGHFISDKKKREHMINTLVSEEELCPVAVEGIKDPLYIPSENLFDLHKDQVPDVKAVRVIAPLDNLLWDRGLVEAMFDFKYTWEVYIPESKRQYGYYVLPILYGDKLIARFEPIKSAKGAPLQIKKWWWEKEVDFDDQLVMAIEKGLSQFSSYLGATSDPKEYMNIILNQ